MKFSFSRTFLVVIGFLFIGYNLASSLDFYPFSFLRTIATPFFSQRITPEEIKLSHQIKPTTVLVVPGHDKDSFGALYNTIREADVTLPLGRDIFDFFNDDPAFDALVLRDENGEYTEWFQKYMDNEESAIRDFRSFARILMNVAFERGGVEKKNIVEHNPAADNTSLNLYGINKWANEHGVDIVIHVHLNDYPRRPRYGPGKYSGFSIYVPESQFPNATASIDIAKSVKKSLERYIAITNFPDEQGGIVPDQELIAIGSNATRDGVSLLIEYGYIYEPQFQDKLLRDALFREMAYQTYVGIKHYFEPTVVLSETTLLPASWDEDLKKGMRSVDVLSLQSALIQEGVYPPYGKDTSTCPLTGYYGSCTEHAVRLFQEKYRSEILMPRGLPHGTGIVGSMTRKKLTILYGDKL